jgi:Domain of unknown function (DUF5664)
MPKHDELEHITVFGPTPINAGIVDTVQIPPETLEVLKKQFPTVRDLSVHGTALKFDTDKLPLNLLSTEAMNQTAAVLKFGAQKYAEHNWRKGFAWSRPLAAAMRHITAFNDGEDTDPESGLSHLAHAACCIMFLLEFQKTHPELDDRYKPNVPQASQEPKQDQKNPYTGL